MLQIMTRKRARWPPDSAGVPVASRSDRPIDTAPGSRHPEIDRWAKPLRSESAGWQSWRYAAKAMLRQSTVAPLWPCPVRERQAPFARFSPGRQRSVPPPGCRPWQPATACVELAGTRGATDGCAGIRVREDQSGSERHQCRAVESDRLRQPKAVAFGLPPFLRLQADKPVRLQRE